MKPELPQKHPFLLPVQLLQECPKAKCRIFIHIAVTSRSSETVMRVLSLPILFSTPATFRGMQRTIEQRVLHSVNISKKKETAIKIVASPPAKEGVKNYEALCSSGRKNRKEIFAEDFYVWLLLHYRVCRVWLGNAKYCDPGAAHVILGVLLCRWFFPISTFAKQSRKTALPVVLVLSHKTSNLSLIHISEPTRPY